MEVVTVTIPFEYYHLLLDLKNAIDNMAGEYEDGAKTTTIEDAFSAIVDYEQDTGAHLPV
jgi:hypothetical protein